MPTGQQYATGVPQTTLSAGIAGGTTNFGVASLTSWPATPFTATIDLGTSSQEAIDVLTVSGNTITNCTRGLDGTAAIAHSPGATFTHTDIGRDFREARAHIDASSSNDGQGHAVHGLTSGSSVVGTTDSQTLTNKTLTGPVVNGSSTFSGTISGNASQTGLIYTFQGRVGAQAQNSTLAGTVAGGPPGSGTFTVGDIVVDSTNNILWYCTASGTPGTWAVVGGKGLIATALTTGTTASETFTIPSWCNNIDIVWSGRSDTNASALFLNMRVNGDTGSNYVWQYNEGTGATNICQGSSGTDTKMHVGAMSGAMATANYFGTGKISLANSAGTTAFKNVTAVSNAAISTAAGGTFSGTYGGQWASSSSVSSVTLFPDTGNFTANCSFAVYASL